MCLNPQASATPAEVGEWLKASLPPYGPDIVIDCAGFQSTLQVGSRLLCEITHTIEESIPCFKIVEIREGQRIFSGFVPL